MSPDLASIIQAWRLVPEHEFGPPLATAQIESAERRFGRQLPTSVVELYGAGDGMSVLGGNLSINALTGDMAVPGFSDQLREWDWPIPAQVVAFGSNGGGDIFGLWYPEGADPIGPTPVVEIGQVFEPGCMALVGTDLPRFVTAWTAYYALLLEAPAEALDAIGLPMDLRVAADQLDRFEPYVRWADPDLPNHEPDPYVDLLDADAVTRLLSQVR